jgi:hypothetical protein
MSTISGTVFTTLCFFVTYEWTLEARVLQNTTLERLAREKHSRFIGAICKLRKIKSFMNTVPDVLQTVPRLTRKY